MKKQYLYILTGLPYSGKTTLTKELVQRFGFSVASVDAVIGEKQFMVEKMSQDDWNFVYFSAYEKLKKLLSEGKTVVFDMGHLKRSERDLARKIAQEAGVEHKLIYVHTAVEEIHRRRSANQATQERSHLEDATMERALGMFEEPTTDESPTVYNQGVDLDAWIEEYIQE